MKFIAVGDTHGDEYAIQLAVREAVQLGCQQSVRTSIPAAVVPMGVGRRGVHGPWRRLLVSPRHEPAL
jgi:hypothetical protein